MIVSRKKTPPQISLQLQGERIEVVNSFLLLGVTVTNNLSWKKHISEITTKAKKLLGFLYRLFRESGSANLEKLYKAIILPHLEYCSSVWDPPQKNHISKIEHVQSFAAKVVTGDWPCDSKQLISSLGWPSLQTRRL